MGIGREVADAYISVHGDLAPFREDLNKANKSMSEWAEENATEITKAWGQRMESEWGSQWNSVVDAMYSGKKVDFNRMIESFDPTDMNAAVEKIEEMLGVMEQMGKISDDQHTDIISRIGEEVQARQAAFEAQQRHQEQQFGWQDAHLKMMDALKAARQKDADHASALIEDQIRLQKKMSDAADAAIKEAIANNERWAKSFEGITEKANIDALEKDFKSVAEAMRTADFSKFAKGFDTFEDLRRRISEVTAAMHDLGRMSDENAQRAIDGANLYIQGEEDKARATQEALDAARQAREEQERYNASIYGMVEAAKKMDLEARFRALSVAIATNDFSGLARGAKNMEDLRIKTMQTAEQMRDMGRLSGNQLNWISAKLGNVAANLGAYNIQFQQANNQAQRHGNRWAFINTMISNAAKKFAGFTGLNVLGDMFREGAAFFQDLDRNAVKIGKMSLLMGSAASTIITAVGGLAVMGQDLAAMGNIALLAPGFLTAAGIGIGVLVSAFKDMGTVLEDLGPKFGKLQDVISEKFWAQAEQPIRNLVDGLLPTLTTKLGETGTAMGGLTGALAAAIDNVPVEMIATMFDRMNAGLDIAQGAMLPLVNAFTTMGLAGSMYFERFATWIVDISNQFNDFIQKAAADGRLLGWIDRAIQGFKDVGTIIASAVGIFNAIGDAAERAGIGGLGAFAGAMERAAAVMQTSGFQDTLVMLFSGAEQAAGAVATAILNLGPALQSIMPTISLALVSIGDTMATVIGYIGEIMQNPALQQGITDFVSGIQTGVEALAPAIGPMATSLGQIGTILGQVAAQLGPLVAAFVTGLAPVLDQITAAFGRITFAAGPVILDIINQLVPVFQNFVNTILPPLENLIMTVLPLLGPAFAAITPIIDALMPIFGSIVSAIGQLVAMIAPFLIPALQQISAAVTPVIEVLGQVVNFILSVLVPILGFLLIGIINNVVGVFQGLSNFIMGFVQIVTAIFTGFGAFFTKLFQGDIIGALNALGTMFGQIWDGIVKMLQGALEFIWNAVQLLFIGRLIQGIKGGLTAIGGFFRSTWDDTVRIVQGALGNINGFVTGILGGVRSFIQSVWQAAVGFVRTAWDNMVSAVSGGVGNVMGFVTSLPGKISGALGNLGGLLLNAGRAIIDGLLNGLKAAWGGVTSFVGGIADWIANNKGPLPYDRQLLIPAGNAIMEGLGKGLMDKLTMLKSILDTVTSTMEDSVTGAFAKSKMYLAGADAALGLADGLKSEKSAIASALSAVMPSSATAGVDLSGSVSTRGVGEPTPGNTTIVNVEAGAIPITTPTKDPALVASKVIDEFAGFSNF